MNKMSADIAIGQSFQLSSSIRPSTADKTIKWTSSNDSAASVSNGKVTGRRTGFTVITAETNTGKYTNCFVTVSPAPTKITLSKTKLTMGIGESFCLNISTTPYAACKTCNWGSSDTSVAVAVNGRVTAKKAGTTRIIARTDNGLTAGCDIVVKPASPNVTFGTSSITIGVGEKYTLSAIIPSDTAAVGRTYYTDNPNVLSIINYDTGAVVGARVGTAKLTVRLYNGKTATCTVNVKKAPTYATLTKTSITMKVGETATLGINIPGDTGCSTKTFKSSNNNIVKMLQSSGSASFKAMKKGTATITATLYNGIQRTCTVTVI